MSSTTGEFKTHVGVADKETLKRLDPLMKKAPPVFILRTFRVCKNTSRKVERLLYCTADGALILFTLYGETCKRFEHIARPDSIHSIFLSPPPPLVDVADRQKGGSSSASPEELEVLYGPAARYRCVFWFQKDRDLALEFSGKQLCLSTPSTAAAASDIKQSSSQAAKTVWGEFVRYLRYHAGDARVTTVDTPGTLIKGYATSLSSDYKGHGAPTTTTSSSSARHLSMVRESPKATAGLTGGGVTVDSAVLLADAEIVRKQKTPIDATRGDAQQSNMSPHRPHYGSFAPPNATQQLHHIRKVAEEYLLELETATAECNVAWQTHARRKHATDAATEEHEALLRALQEAEALSHLSHLVNNICRKKTQLLEHQKVLDGERRFTVLRRQHALLHKPEMQHSWARTPHHQSPLLVRAQGRVTALGQPLHRRYDVDSVSLL